MKLPKELTTVTPLSKYLAMVVFIALPFVGFFLGMRYQEMTYLAKRQEMETNLAIKRIPTPTPMAIPITNPSISANWKTYRNEEFGFEVKYPEDRFSMVPVKQVGISPASQPGIYYDGLKLIDPKAKERLGRNECSYGERGGTEICNARSEDGISFIIVDKDISEYERMTEKSEDAETITLAGREGIMSGYGAEGYNTDQYFIPLTQGSTLVIIKDWDAGLSNEQGVIRDETVPEFDQILSTFKFTQ